MAGRNHMEDALQLARTTIRYTTDVHDVVVDLAKFEDGYYVFVQGSPLTENAPVTAFVAEFGPTDSFKDAVAAYNDIVASETAMVAA